MSARAAERRAGDRAPEAVALAVKIGAYVAAQKAKALRGEDHGPTTQAQIAARVSTPKRPLGQSTVATWMLGQSMPHSFHVVALEELLGGPWAWIIDPDTSWPYAGGGDA